MRDPVMRPDSYEDTTLLLFLGLAFGVFWFFYAAIFVALIGPAWIVKRLADRIHEDRYS